MALQTNQLDAPVGDACFRSDMSCYCVQARRQYSVPDMHSHRFPPLEHHKKLLPLTYPQLNWGCYVAARKVRGWWRSILRRTPHAPLSPGTTIASVVYGQKMDGYVLFLLYGLPSFYPGAKIVKPRSAFNNVEG
jgi:hypothetical protein